MHSRLDEFGDDPTIYVGLVEDILRRREEVHRRLEYA